MSGQEFEIKTESIDIKEEWQIDSNPVITIQLNCLDQPNIKKENEINDETEGHFAPAAHFGLDETMLDFIVDDNPLKQGLFSPITHIPVLSAEALYDQKPDYLLILAWNFSEPIIKMHENYSNEIGKFIIRMPEPKVES